MTDQDAPIDPATAMVNAREPATADVERGQWTRVQTPPSVGGHYAIGGYVERGGMPRHFERAFASVILTIDGPSWSHCDDRKAHIPIEYWQDLGAHPEHAALAQSSTPPASKSHVEPTEGNNPQGFALHDVRP